MNPTDKYLRGFFAKSGLMEGDVAMKALSEIEGIFNHTVDEVKVPGISITVLQDGKTIFQRGYGFANLACKTPVDPKKSVFRIASVSKPIAATALAHMVREGIIDLDTSFYRYVPYYPKKKWDFTIRQLASHTAGIRGYRGFECGLNKPYSIKESIEIFKDDDLLFKPGADYGYTSFDWVLISLAIEEVTGLPFKQYVKTKVLEPLGMYMTFDPIGYTTYCKNTREDNLVVFYSKGRKGFRPAVQVNNNYKLAGGGYLSTSDDVAKLGLTYMQGSMFEKYLTSQFLTSQVIKGKPTCYGLGWQVGSDSKGRPYYGHIGNGVGGYSNFFVYPEQKIVFAIFVNCTEPKLEEEFQIIKNLFLSNLSST